MSISIVTATYNAAAHLRHCLASLAAQTAPLEHIIVDGGSTDGTVNIIREYAVGRPATRFVSEPDQGLYDALNKGLRLATGEVIGLLHADDFYPHPDILAKVAKVFEDPQVEACYGDLVYVREKHVESLKCAARVELASSMPLNRLPARSEDADLTIQQFNDSTVQQGSFKIVRYWQSGPFAPEKFKWGWMPPHPAFFVRRSVYERYGLFNLELGTAADYELMLRVLFRHRIRCACLPEVLVCMRVGGVSNRSIEARLEANRMDRRAWKVNGLRPYPWTLWFKPLRKLPQWWRRPGRPFRDSTDHAAMV